MALLPSFALICLSIAPQQTFAQQRVTLDMDQAIDLALAHNHALKAARSNID